MNKRAEESGQVLGLEIDLALLLALWNFGWLRIQELAMLLWPGSEHRLSSCHKKVKSLQERKLIICRTLPGHAGTAIVLAQRGADMLNHWRDVDACSGKDFGDVVDGLWQPPQTWQHDLLAAGILCYYVGHGATAIYPERQIRRDIDRQLATSNDLREDFGDGQNALSVPDGLIVFEGAAMWLEVERARKGGEYMRALARTLIRAQGGTAPELCGVWPTTTIPAIAYLPRASARDDRGFSINHRERVLSALNRESPIDFLLDCYELEVSGPGVIGVNIALAPVRSELVTQRVEQIKWTYSATNPLELTGRRDDGYSAVIYPVVDDDSELQWHISFSPRDGGPRQSVANGLSCDFEQAKRDVAAAMRHWPGGEHHFWEGRHFLQFESSSPVSDRVSENVQLVPNPIRQ